MRSGKWRYILAVAVAAGVSPWCRALSLDSVVNLPAMGLPVVNYTPETSWEFGAAAQGYFRLPQQTKTSIVQLDGAYTLKKQWYVNASGTLYFGGRLPWQLQFRAWYSDRPTSYYGIGNTGNTEVGLRRVRTPFTLRKGLLSVQTRLSVGGNWSVGPLFDFQYHHSDLTEEQATYPICVEWGLGIGAQYDTRDRVFYPTRGLLFKTTLTHYEPTLGSTARLTMAACDLRQFVPLPCDFVWAWQCKTQWAVSAGDIPYMMLPCLGGQDGLRGVSTNMFRDDAMVLLQTELRIPIWSIFRATVFAGIGDVYDLHHWQWATPKVGYGLGLRVSINRAKVNIRFDVARSNVDPRWNDSKAYSFYFTATEAF